jgi:hypothetical protein
MDQVKRIRSGNVQPNGSDLYLNFHFTVNDKVKFNKYS